MSRHWRTIVRHASGTCYVIVSLQLSLRACSAACRPCTATAVLCATFRSCCDSICRTLWPVGQPATSNFRWSFQIISYIRICLIHDWAVISLIQVQNIYLHAVSFLLTISSRMVDNNKQYIIQTKSNQPIITITVSCSLPIVSIHDQS